MKKMYKSKTKKHAHVDSKNQAIEVNEKYQVTLRKAKTSGPNFSLLQTQMSNPMTSTVSADKECAHAHSNMRPTNAVYFARFPYRPSLMTLLRQVSTLDADIMATSYNSHDYPRVYASFQNHWNPIINMPVLSIVGACNTNISPPHFKRRCFEYGIVTVMATTSMMQHYVEFKIPLIQDMTSAHGKIVIESSNAFDVGDQMTSYILHPQDNKNPVALIKLWNLSSYGCMELHHTALYQVPRVKVTDELHIFGLSGDRETTFNIDYPLVGHNVIKMLDEIDLVAIGYRYKKSAKPMIRGNFDRVPADVTDVIMMARMMPQSATYRHPESDNHIVLPERKTTFYGKTLLKPFFYPPVIRHKPGQPFGPTKPILFPAGFHTYRNILIPPDTTVSDIINDLTYANNKFNENACKHFAAYCQVSEEEVRQNLKVTFDKFIALFRPEFMKMETMPYTVRPIIDDVMPLNWTHSSKHSVVSDTTGQVSILKEGTELPYASCSDDFEAYTSFARIRRTKEDLLPSKPYPDEVKDTSLWFPKKKPRSTSFSSIDTTWNETLDDEPSKLDKPSVLVPIEDLVKTQPPPVHNDSDPEVTQSDVQHDIEEDEEKDVPQVFPPMSEELQQATVNGIIMADDEIIECVQDLLFKNGHPITTNI